MKLKIYSVKNYVICFYVGIVSGIVHIRKKLWFCLWKLLRLKSWKIKIFFLCSTCFTLILLM